MDDSLASAVELRTVLSAERMDSNRKEDEMHIGRL